MSKSSSGSIWTDYVEGKREIKPRPKANLQFWGHGSFIHVSKQCSNLPEKWALCLRGSQQSGLTDLSNLMPGLWTESTQNKQGQFPASPAPSPPAQPTPCPQILFSLAGRKVHDNSSKGLIVKTWRGKSCQTGKTVRWKKKRYTVEMCDRYKESIV